MDKGNPRRLQLFTRNQRQIQNNKRGRNSLPLAGAGHSLRKEHASPEKYVHISKIIKSKQIVIKYLVTYTYTEVKDS